jgi:hypothetical protein
MCNWHDIQFCYGNGIVKISGKVIQDTCNIIYKAAQQKKMLTYTDVMRQLKQLRHSKINIAIIGEIVGAVSIQLSESTTPSIYPSALVVKKDTRQPGESFWKVHSGTNPPALISKDKRELVSTVPKDVFLLL